MGSGYFDLALSAQNQAVAVSALAICRVRDAIGPLPGRDDAGDPSRVYVAVRTRDTTLADRLAALGLSAADPAEVRAVCGVWA